MTVEIDEKYEKIMRHVFEIKTSSAALAKLYASKKYAEIIKYAREAWGFVPSFLLENIELNVLNGAKTTVLAAYITDHYMIYKYHRKMRNIIITIVGMGGSGKTTYAVWSCIGAYMITGLTYKQALKLVSESVFFDLKTFTDTMKKIVKNNIWMPCIILDDIGEWMPKYWRELGLTSATEFFKLLEQAKDWTGVIIFTARSFEGSVTSAIRDKSDLIVDASEQIIDLHRMNIFEYYQMKDWSKKETKAKKKRMLYVDAMPANVKMPDEIWEHMLQVRKETAIKSIEKLEKLTELLPELEKRALEKIEKKLSGATRKS